MDAPLLNQRAVRALALDLARQNRAKSFTRVSPEFLRRANSALTLWVASEIHRHPSKGKTIH